jgi:hypothetical protein
MLTARRGGSLGGYLVRHLTGNTCVIDDLLAEDDSACTALLLETIAIGRREGIHTISASWPAADPGKCILQKNGFHLRESSPVVLLRFERPVWQQVGQPKVGSHLSHGDWET